MFERGGVANKNQRVIRMYYGPGKSTRTITVRLDDGCEAKLDGFCETLGLSLTDVVKAGLALLQQQSPCPDSVEQHSSIPAPWWPGLT